MPLERKHHNSSNGFSVIVRLAELHQRHGVVVTRCILERVGDVFEPSDVNGHTPSTTHCLELIRGRS